MKRALLLLALGACGTTLRQRNHIAGSFNGALLACDYGQTVDQARVGWPDGHEHNMLLGPTPSVTKLTMYFGAIALAGAASTRLPEWARASLYSMVAIGESATVLGNRYFVDHGTWCGL